MATHQLCVAQSFFLKLEVVDLMKNRKGLLLPNKCLTHTSTQVNAQEAMMRRSRTSDFFSFVHQQPHPDAQSLVAKLPELPNVLAFFVLKDLRYAVH
jgi:hypothetical protein